MQRDKVQQSVFHSTSQRSKSFNIKMLGCLLSDNSHTIWIDLREGKLLWRRTTPFLASPSTIQVHRTWKRTFGTVITLRFGRKNVFALQIQTSENKKIYWTPFVNAMLRLPSPRQSTSPFLFLTGEKKNRKSTKKMIFATHLGIWVFLEPERTNHASRWAEAGKENFMTL